MIDTSESLKEKFIKRGFWIYLFTFLGGPLGYFTKVMLSGDLSVSEVGILYGILSLVGLLSTYNDLGFAEALGFFLPKFAIAKDYASFKWTMLYAITAQILSSILLSTGLYYFSDVIATRYFGDANAGYILRVFCLFFIASNFFHLINNTLLALQDAKIQNLFSFLRNLFCAGFIAILFFSGTGNLERYSWAWIVAILLNVIGIYTYFYLTKYREYLIGIRPRLDKALFKQVFSYALLILLTANIGTVLSQVDMQMIIVLLGTEQAGYYTNYISLINIPFLVLTPLVGFLFPVISSLQGEEWKEKIRLIKRYFQDFVLAIAPAVTCFFLVFGPDMARFFFTDKFLTSGYILAWSAPFLIFNFLIQLNFQILAGLGQIKTRMKILLVGLVFNLILNYTFIKMFGVYGSALAVGISWMPMWYLSDRATKEYNPTFSTLFFLKNSIVAIGISALFYTILQLPAIQNAAQSRVFLLFLLPIAAISYIIGFIASNLSLAKTAKKEVFDVIKKKKGASAESIAEAENASESASLSISQ